ncbi:2-amino-4-hydroxy-6-hydroxymethyldihydropteridine diphosphokinase [Paraferrimonas sp. SM1919]|uniref:2-amino-4-hydroxy-6- hydroxymethyldihydropteridine diphosphokinase n=1 Tax=Paraferrimonas sp. SM1919 TaxID=2662263 RepID=UPI001F09122C|nr:2-amino-4-hydroxy-6-hydroxymethyldihydropteridine diphosphokinase [Paraferrimonas sp. SM1919]
MICYLALGANLDAPIEQLNNAVAALTQAPAIQVLHVSSWVTSEAMGEVAQPDYVNGVVAIETDLAPLALLDLTQSIENAQGRTREVRWGPRTLDIDILLMGDLCMESERLTLPHYGMKQRNFVLEPLAQIAPQLLLPCGTGVQTLVDALGTPALHRLN